MYCWLGKLISDNALARYVRNQMIYPYTDTLDGFGSRFGLVVLAAKRAKQLRSGASPMISTASTNPLTIALEEIALHKVATDILESDEPIRRIEETDFASLFPLGSLGVVAGGRGAVGGVGSDLVGDTDEDWDIGDEAEDEVEEEEEEVEPPIPLSSLETDDEVVDDQEEELVGTAGLSEAHLEEEAEEDADWHDDEAVEDTEETA